MLKNKRVLITGGGGFIGTQLARRLSRENEVTLLDRDFTANAFALSRLGEQKSVRLVTADIASPESAAQAAQAQVVFHTAAVLGVQKVLHNTVTTMEVNYGGTAHMLRACAAGGRCERFVFFSTSEVYGASAFRASEEGEATFPALQDVRWGYALSKLAGEHLALGYFHEQKLPVTILRPFNIYGPGRVGSYAVLSFILRALAGEELAVYGDGTQLRAWCFIDDFCQGALAAAEVPAAVGKAFNLGNPQGTITNYELARRIVGLAQSRSAIVCKPADFRDIERRVPQIALAQELLGYRPAVELDEGLNQTIAWVKQNYGWLNAKR